MNEAVVFTLLPQDVTRGGDLRAAIFVSPQLTPDGPGATAADFPAFADWPAIVREAVIVVERAGGGSVERGADDAALRSDLWRRYLAPIDVRGWSHTDLSTTELRSFDAQAIVALAQGLYHSIAAGSKGAHPDPLGGGLRNLGAAYQSLTRGDRREDIDRRVDAALRRRQAQRREAEAGGMSPGEPGGMAPNVAPLSPADALKNATNAALDLAEARRFYDRPEARDPDAAKYPVPSSAFTPASVEKPAPDFHDVLTSLGDHPELLRALGIVIPVTLPAAFVGTGGDLRVRLVHDRLQANPITAQPWTRTVVDGRSFQPVSETGDLQHGMLLLDDPHRFHVGQVDIDSTALLVEQRVANVYSIAKATQAKGPVAADLPALRSTGLTVTRLRRALVLDDRIGRSKTNADAIAAGNEVVLFAEDLTRGFRVDVHDGSDWRSLMERVVRYVDRDDGREQFRAKGEAYLKASSLTKVPQAAVDRSYLHEAVFGWDGWSLAVPRPGRHIPHTPDATEALTDEAEQLDGQLALNFEAEIVPGTLPRLRYAGRYSFRARTVDLTGRSTREAGDEHRTPDDSFRRFQPILHPTVVPRFAFAEGESTLRLVIRSGVDADNASPAAAPVVVDAATYAATLNTLAPRTFVRFHADCQRHLAPPKTSQHEAELLGGFDDAIGVAADAPGAAALYRKAYARARREQGTLADRVVLSATDPTASTPAQGIHLVPPLARDGDFATQAELDAKLPSERGAAPEAGFVIVHDTDELKVPYLPDPLATGIVLRFTGSGTAAGWSHVQPLPYGGEWPDLDTYRVVLVSGAAPNVTVAGTLVTIALPPGGGATVRSSSSIAATTLDLLGMWDWIGDTVAAAGLPDVLAGGHQMITPGEELTLVHATQRPLVRPTVQRDVRPVRNYGQTFARFAGALRCQAATTGRLDLDGSWSEWFDDPASGTPPELNPGHSGHAFAITVEQDDRVALDDPLIDDLKHEFGDTKHRKVAYVTTATTRFREYLPVQVIADPGALQVVGPERVIHVPNAARPAAPVVHAVMPTFGWSDLPEDEFDLLARARSRRGGLRVWLARPWYTSGEGELLGVVVSGADGILGDTDLRRQYISLWGKDPIRRSGQLEAPLPRPRDFSGAGLLQRDRLTLGETGARHPGVSVVGHPVHYSESRDLWYADITVDPDEAYWPFLRLALTRFQPWSIPDAELSQVAIVDFVQLTNERTAAIARPDRDRVRVTVSGIAERRSAPSMLPPPALGGFSIPAPPTRGVRAWVERRGSLASDLDWHRVGERVELPRVDEDEVARVWSGDVPLEVPIEERRPGTDPGGEGSDWRLVVAEWESLLHDDPHGEPSRIERIVYLDRFPL